MRQDLGEGINDGLQIHRRRAMAARVRAVRALVLAQVGPGRRILGMALLTLQVNDETVLGAVVEFEVGFDLHRGRSMALGPCDTR